MVRRHSRQRIYGEFGDLRHPGGREVGMGGCTLGTNLTKEEVIMCIEPYKYWCQNLE